jgi:hypothetical protein
MQIIMTTEYPEGVEYYETRQLTTIGGILMTYGRQRCVTMSAQLSPEEKEHGLEYLLSQLQNVSSEKLSIFVWRPDH